MNSTQYLWLTTVAGVFAAVGCHVVAGVNADAELYGADGGGGAGSVTNCGPQGECVNGTCRDSVCHVSDGGGGAGGGGAGGSACDTGLADCNGYCVDTSIDSENCGTCNNPCQAPAGCVSGSCTCPDGLVYCDGACIDTGSDAENCGACGHSCQEAPCRVSLCEPDTLYRGTDDPIAIVAYGGSVYWISYNGGLIQQWLTDEYRPGGYVRTLVEYYGSYARDLAVDGTNLYWAIPPSPRVERVSVDGGEPVVVTANLQGAYDIATDGQSVYCAVDGQVVKILIDSGSVDLLVSGQESPAGLVVDRVNVYWFTDDGVIMKAPIGDGDPVAIAVGQEGLSDIAVSGADVYWLTNGSVKKAPVDGGLPMTVVADHGGKDIELDATHIYWTDGSAIMKVSRDGGKPLTLAVAQAEERIIHIAVDDTNVYWIGEGFPRGFVMKVAK